MNRRDLLKYASLSGLAFLIGCRDHEEGAVPEAQNPAPVSRPELSAKEKGKVAVASKGSAKEMVLAALGAFGGIEAFVRPGNFVVVKPNIGWQRTPEQAANTSPEVVGAVVELCKKAGARRVRVIEHTCDSPAQICFEMSGIEKAVKAAGGEIIAASQEGQYRRIEIPSGKSLRSASVIRDILEADCFINLPIAKDHSAARLTVGLKNLMGTVWNRQEWHDKTLSQCIADYATAVRPHLTLVDATRILLAQGPKGPGPTKDTHQVIASVDPVAADAYATTLFNLKPDEIDYLPKAQELGLGEINLNRLKIHHV